MNKWYLVIDNKIQPIPFSTREDALDELEVIREKTLVCTWDIIPDDDSRLNAYNGVSTPSASLGEIIDFIKGLFFFLAVYFIWKVFNG